jgi:succinoglycan biosynthesis transport protein ExoP
MPEMFENGETQSQPREINLLDYWRIVWKRRWLIGAFTLAVLTVVAVLTFTATPIYTAKGTLLIEKEPNILSFEDIFQIETFQQDYYQTQYKLLQGYAVAERAVEQMNLAERRAKLTNAKITSKKDQVDPKNGEYVRSVAESFQKSLSIVPVRMTRLVEVQFKDKDPKLAADAVNAVFDAFIDLNIEVKYAATEQASEFLTDQITTVRKEIETGEKKLQAYGAEKNIIALSDTETTTVEKLGEINRALTGATIERVQKEAYYNEIRSATSDYIPETMTNPLIQRLREEYARVNQEYRKKAETFKPDYPEMQKLQSELDTARSALVNETQNIIKGAFSDYQAALKREQSLAREFDKQRQVAMRMNSSGISYYSLKTEIDNKKSLLDGLLKRQSETGVAARLKGLRTSNVRVADRARVPRSPSSPRKKLNLLLALFFGLFGGVGLAFLMDYLDNTVKTSEDVEKYGGLPTLGVVPEFDPEAYKKGYGYGYGYGHRRKHMGPTSAKGGEDSTRTWISQGQSHGQGEKKPVIKSIELIAHFAPKSNFSESYRSIRTAFLLSSVEPKLKMVIVTSSLPVEGKTANVCNLAVTLAQTEKKVLLVDADLRKPRQHRIFGIKNLNGLTNYLTVGTEMKHLAKLTAVPNLYLMNAGPVPPNPSELLGSEKMGELLAESRKFFDYVLIDAPPIMAVTDALVLGPHADGVIIVVWSGKTPRESLKEAKEKLDMMNIKTLGVIINRLNLKEHSYYYKHHYSHYNYYGEE